MADRKDKDFNMRKDDKNPKGGMSRKGIERYNKETGSNLKPGVKGAADTPEKMRRKGSFLTKALTINHILLLMKKEIQPEKLKPVPPGMSLFQKINKICKDWLKKEKTF